MEEMKTVHDAALRKKETQVCKKISLLCINVKRCVIYIDYAAQHTNQSIQTGIFDRR